MVPARSNSIITSILSVLICQYFITSIYIKLPTAMDSSVLNKACNGSDFLNSIPTVLLILIRPEFFLLANLREFFFRFRVGGMKKVKVQSFFFLLMFPEKQ